MSKIERTFQYNSKEIHLTYTSEFPNAVIIHIDDEWEHVDIDDLREFLDDIQFVKAQRRMKYYEKADY